MSQISSSTKNSHETEMPIISSKRQSNAVENSSETSAERRTSSRSVGKDSSSMSNSLYNPDALKQRKERKGREWDNFEIIRI